MVGLEARLKGLKEVIVGHVRAELGSNNFFQEFGHEWEVGDGTVVGEGVWVQARFFKDWGDSSSFEDGGDNTVGKGQVNELGDVRAKSREAGFKQGSGDGI